ncbi:Tad domain-containing protein [Actibacterium sp. 188UL27-1]|uniref:TadE/TadG family type IV pilus assembly protein n=1 Tax=Actibacterium sp. 188UL27-1 TaxID=2786961 RepID=UPI001957CFC1|nr:Tad domain-containing protein [Actibacterium sp. 188UL27-1]MBM7069190.1 VWA domain-containing protein [Actibacterium sp. 188UL27-1]
MTIRLKEFKRLSAQDARFFARDEDGGMIVFSLYMLIAMLMIGGIAFDLMRYENLRTQLQNTTDAATLAAANLNNSQDPEFVVNDYFKKAIVSQFLKDVKVTPTATSRTVSAKAEARVVTTFMQWSGVDELELTTLGTARQDVGEIEIAMVLDMSGSMTRNGREGKLKEAAKIFIDTVYPEPLAPPSERPTISMIPYNDQVNLGPNFGPYFNVEDTHNFSWCVRLPSSVFETVTWDEDLELERIAHYDRVTHSGNRRKYRSYNDLPQPQCPTDNTNAILMHEYDPVKLRTYIEDDLEADPYSWTAISLGAKFGVAMLDPSTNGIVQDIITDDSTPGVPNLLDVNAADLPKPYDYFPYPSATKKVKNIKIMVLMTDGRNTRQFDLRNGDATGELDLKRGPSPVYFSERILNDGNGGTGDDIKAYAVNIREMFPEIADEDYTFYDWYYAPGINVPGDGINERIYYFFEEDLGGKSPLEFLEEDANQTRLSYPTLYGSRTVSYISNEIFPSDRWANGYRSPVETYNLYGELDDQTEDLCKEAQDAGIVIYAVAFEAPPDGKDLMRKCASPATNFFEVEGDEVKVAFETIARNINQLKLTQ